MCCCGKPIINGELGYKWQPNDAPSVRQPNPPPLGERDELLYDEPGRCGGLNSHCHHYRLVLSGSMLDLLVRHGSGDERITLSTKKTLLETFKSLDPTARYWMLNCIHHTHREGKARGVSDTSFYWRKAASEGRIKTRKLRGQSGVKVTVLPEILQQPAS